MLEMLENTVFVKSIYFMNVLLNIFFITGCPKSAFIVEMYMDMIISKGREIRGKYGAAPYL